MLRVGAVFMIIIKVVSGVGYFQPEYGTTYADGPKVIRDIR